MSDGTSVGSTKPSPSTSARAKTDRYLGRTAWHSTGESAWITGLMVNVTHLLLRAATFNTQPGLPLNILNEIKQTRQETGFNEHEGSLQIDLNDPSIYQSV